MLVIDKDLGLGGGLRSCEVYFATPGNAELEARFDLIRYLQCPVAPSDDAPRQDFTTTLIDLQTTAPLIEGFNKKTQYEIRLSDKVDNKQCFWLRPDEAMIDAITDRLMAFFALKGLPANRPFWQRKFMEFHRLGALVFSLGYLQGHQEPLACHSYFFDGQRARLLTSFAQFRGLAPAARQAVGRLNRCLHLHDMQQFQQAGAQCYDLGGIASGEMSEEQANITKFKLNFNGRVVQEFHFTRACSALGQQALDRLDEATRQRFMQ